VVGTRAVIVSLTGGAGNQLFQYAAGRTLATHRAAPLKVVARRAHASRTLGIRDLLDIPKANLTLQERFLGGFGETPLDRLPTIIKQPAKILDRRVTRFFVVDQTADEVGNPMPVISSRYRYIHLRGLFQHRSYYEPVLDQIVEEMHTKLASDLDVAAGDGVVAMHFRRGDYVLNDYALPMSFHDDALTRVARQYGCARVVVMSDDVDFSALATEHIRARGFDAVDFESDIAHTDRDSFLALAAAQYVIMSNSTFVWWAAVLGDRLRPGTHVVVCPQPWLPARSVSTAPTSPDLYRSDWEVHPICG
jgi:hypothetical protein